MPSGGFCFELCTFLILCYHLISRPPRSYCVGERNDKSSGRNGVWCPLYHTKLHAIVFARALPVSCFFELGFLLVCKI